MSDIIQLLPDSIANQIAAGEVIQRPASVVKELVENAVDAGASEIQLILKNSGKSLIQIIDDGCGMSETDARMSLERHATSKLRTAADLFAIRTMGFRGEALASIAAVAQLEIKTRRRIEDLGTRLVVEGSEVKVQEPCQCAPGTSMAVKNLFFNVPARRNFLKSDSVEFRHIQEEFSRIALANTDVFFRLFHNDVEVLHLPPGNLMRRIVGLHKPSYQKRLVPVREETDLVKIDGYVIKPEFSKKSRGEQYFFVNGRFIRSGHLHHALVAAFDDLLPKDTYPSYFIFMDIDPARIDVNVHPTKQEIKFEDERMIYNYLKTTVRHGLGRASIMPTLDFDADPMFAVNRPRTEEARPTDNNGGEQGGVIASRINTGGSTGATPRRASETDEEAKRRRNNLRHWAMMYETGRRDDEDGDAAAPSARSEEDFSPEPGFVSAASTPTDEEAPLVLTSRMDAEETLMSGADGSSPQPHRAAELKEPYQLHQRYIVSSIKSGALLIDQRAAHERILYEQYLRRLRERPGDSQHSLFPARLELTPTETVALTALLPDLEQLGFALEHFGGNSFLINGLPTELAEGHGALELVRDLLARYLADTDSQLSAHERLARSLARGAAVRRGTSLDVAEMRSLIDRLFACEMPYRAPGGRRCYLTFELDDLERRFAE